MTDKLLKKGAGNYSASTLHSGQGVAHPALRPDPFAKAKALNDTPSQLAAPSELSSPKPWSIDVAIWNISEALTSDGLGADKVGELDTAYFNSLSDCLDYIAKAITENFDGLPASFHGDVVRREASFRSMYSRTSGNTLFRVNFVHGGVKYLATGKIVKS